MDWIFLIIMFILCLALVLCIGYFYKLITNEHCDKIYKVEVDDIMDVVDNFANRLLRRIR